MKFPIINLPTYDFFPPYSIYIPSDDSDVIVDLIKTLDKHQHDIKSLISKHKLMLLQFPLLIKAILLTNISIWLLWKISPDFMSKHASFKLSNIESKRIWSSILSSFSHISISHLISNMSIFLVFGPPVLKEFGEPLFALSILISSISCCISTLFYETFLIKLFPESKRHQARKNNMHIGFSGINMTIMFLFALLKPDYPIRMLGLVSTVPMKRFYGNIIWTDLCGILIDSFLISTGISHIGHFGGLLGGLIFRSLLCNIWNKKKLYVPARRRYFCMNCIELL